MNLRDLVCLLENRVKADNLLKEAAAAKGHSGLYAQFDVQFRESRELLDLVKNGSHPKLFENFPDLTLCFTKSYAQAILADFLRESFNRLATV
jgi:hypothetical protein